MKKVICTEHPTPKVLIVDDDPCCSFLAETILKEHCCTETVTNGHDALEAIEKCKYDVILMDINLNNMAMDGIRTMRMIRYHRRHRNIKILAVTANSQAREWFLKEGFDGHVMKPLIDKKIIAEINKGMNRVLY